MGKFKEKNGQTRLQAIIARVKDASQKIPSEVLDLVGIAFPRIGAIKTAIESLKKSDQVDDYLKSDLLDALHELQDEMEMAGERHTVDMNSDNWLSKSFRPISGFTILLFCMYITFTSGYYSKVDFEGIRSGKSFFLQFTENDKAMWMEVLQIVMGFYFGGRAVMQIVNSSKGLLNKKTL